MTDAGEALRILRSFDLTETSDQICCPLLQLRSENDNVFLLSPARLIYDGAASTDKTIYVWSQGDHCLYDRPEERNLTIADWFASRLADS